MTALEFLQVVIFLAAVAWLGRKVYSSKVGKSNLNFSAADYSIIVKNLAPDTTEVDLIRHFSNLYRLDDKDWKGRLKVEELEPVANVQNTRKPIFEGTWVAKCIVFALRKIESLLHPLTRTNIATLNKDLCCRILSSSGISIIPLPVFDDDCWCLEQP